MSYFPPQGNGMMPPPAMPPPSRNQGQNGMPPPAMPPPPRQQQDPNAMPPPPGRPAAAVGMEDGGMPPPPPKSGPTLSGRDRVLLEMQKEVFDFYSKYAPQKVNKEIFAIALQLWWDTGLSGLNGFLIGKYGAGIELGHDPLEEFDREGEDVTIIPKMDLNAAAGRQHLLVKTMLKTNTAEYFQSNKKRVTDDMRKSFNQGMLYKDYLAQNGIGGEVNKSFSFAPSPPGSVPPLVVKSKSGRGRSSKHRQSKEDRMDKSKKKKKKKKKGKKKRKYSSSSSSSSDSD